MPSRMPNHMPSHTHQHHQPVNEELHPLVYRTMVGLTIWLVLSIWFLFGHGGYVGLTLAMITLFFLVAVGIPTLIWNTWRRHTSAREQHHDVTERFGQWTGKEFRTWTGRLSGREAAMQILLPLAAVSIGMTIFGLVFLFDVPHAGY